MAFFLGIVFYAGHLYAQEEQYELIKKEGSISIYERWTVFPNSNPPVEAREVKGEFTFRNSIEAAVLLIKDEKRISKWQHHVTEFNVYLQSDSTKWFEYSYRDIPWPVSDQDHLLEYTLYEKRPGKEIFIEFKTRENEKLAPKKEGVTRMRLCGSWSLVQVTPQQTKAVYKIVSMPGNIPRIFTDPVIRSNLMSTIKGFIEQMEN